MSVRKSRQDRSQFRVFVSLRRASITCQSTSPAPNSSFCVVNSARGTSSCFVVRGSHSIHKTAIRFAHRSDVILPKVLRSWLVSHMPASHYRSSIHQFVNESELRFCTSGCENSTELQPLTLGITRSAVSSGTASIPRISTTCWIAFIPEVVRCSNSKLLCVPRHR